MPKDLDEPTRTPRGAGAVATVRTVATTVLVIAVIALSVLLYLQHRTLNDERGAAADRAKAEQIASAYALGAAKLDYHDLTPWLNALKAGTTPEVTKQFDAIADTMREVLTPLRMVTSGKLIMARSDDGVGGIFEVKVAVDVTAQNVQAPQGSVATTVYTISLDRGRDWIITKVGDPASPSLFGGVASVPTTTNPTAAVPTSGTVAPTESVAVPTLPDVPTLPAVPSLPGTPN